eukprot:scaffold107240_cov49-Phaeocystis_antarctica.AAC.1
MFDEPIGLDGALAALPAPSAAPAASSSSWLEQQELAELLEDQLTGPLAVEVVFDDAIETIEATQEATEETSMEPGETVEEAIEDLLADF